MTAYEVRNLTVAYGEEVVLWDIGFSVPKGAFVGIIGPNGAGKSTLLKASLGIVSTLSGKVSFFDQPFASARSRVAYVPQRRDIDWHFPITAFDVVLMGRYASLGPCKWVKKADKEAARAMLHRLGLDGLADKQIGQLSGGQRQRLFIARALLQDADLLLLDEPFAGVDIASETVIMEVLHTLQKQGKTAAVVHHDIHTAEEYFDHIALLNVHLTAFGKTSEVFTEENLQRTYGGHAALFEKATRRSNEKRRGFE